MSDSPSTPQLRASELIGQIALTFSLLEDDIDACLHALTAADASTPSGSTTHLRS